ncbi:hypothetical protein SDC9_178198 [bioreactor metagenome]|uniref:Uncharacterized protein n=1 Tax=bioreactor metagenome TaxID=1076179 RepID=A0A645GVG0_9ZZZZ
MDRQPGSLDAFSFILTDSRRGGDNEHPALQSVPKHVDRILDAHLPVYLKILHQGVQYLPVLGKFKGTGHFQTAEDVLALDLLVFAVDSNHPCTGDADDVLSPDTDDDFTHLCSCLELCLIDHRLDGFQRLFYIDD